MLIIDAYNALQTSGVLPAHLAGIELEGLCRLISRSRYATRQALLVCDGKPHSAALAKARADRGSPGHYQLHSCGILFAGAGKDADSLIERLLFADPAPARITLVSSDRRLRKAAGKRGSSSLSSPEFLAQLAADDARPPKEPYPQFAQEIPLDPYSLKLWMNEFGFEVDAEGAGHQDQGTGPKSSREPTGIAKPLPEGTVGGERRHLKNAPPPQRAKSTNDASKLPSNSSAVLANPHITDPLLLEALRHWDGRMTAEDFDMRRWLAGEKRKGRPTD